MAKKKSSRKRPVPPSEKVYKIHLIAAAAGELLGGLAAVAISQFPEVQFEVMSHPLQNSVEKLEATLDKLSGDRLIVLHALADENAKLLVRNQCIVRHIPQYDVTGLLVNFIAECVGALPQNDISRLHQLDSAYQRRIEAMEFALEHDDSLGLRSLRDADLVIVGVSRVSKSPTTLYLSSRGYKVANVSIAPEVGFPQELAQVPAKKEVVAFTMQPKRLQEIRAERAKRLGAEPSDYNDLSAIRRELMMAEDKFQQRGYPVIDVTNCTIEQTAAQIVEILKRP